MAQTKHLIVLVGPTAVGKTDLSVQLATKFNCEILSADSRQFYKGLKIGTAAPADELLNKVKHHFISFLEPDSYYNASNFEHDVLKKLDAIFEKTNVALLTGGSMMYVDAVTKGIDLMPDVDLDIRKMLYDKQKNGEIDSLRLLLKKLDPVYYAEADLKNPVRIVHALEVCLTTGKPFSGFRKKTPRNRNFNIIKIGLERPRDILYERINHRVYEMIKGGLLEEATKLLPYRNTNALNTVGYKEVYDFIDGKYNLEMAIEKIQVNTRRYAKKQITWFKRDSEIEWFHPDNTEAVLACIDKKMNVV